MTVGIKILGKKCRNIFAPQLANLKHEFNQQAAEYHRHYQFVSNYDPKAVDEARRQGHGVGLNRYSEGDARMKRVETWLNKFKLAREPDQVALHDWCKLLLLPHFYGKEFESHRSKLMKKHRLKHFPYVVRYGRSRRAGKSFGLAMFVLVAALECVKIDIAVFAQNQRASTSFKKYVLQLADELGVSNRIIDNNEQLLTLARPEYVDAQGRLTLSKTQIRTKMGLNRIFCYPASAKGNSLLLPCCLCVFSFGWLSSGPAIFFHSEFQFPISNSIPIPIRNDTQEIKAKTTRIFFTCAFLSCVRVCDF